MQLLTERGERDRRVLARMVDIYCRRRHEKGGGLCADCRELLEYASERIARCPLGDRKTTCRKCTVHCYRPDMRERVREVMRYSGPRMMLYSPVEALRHLWRELKS